MSFPTQSEGGESETEGEGLDAGGNDVNGTNSEDNDQNPSVNNQNPLANKGLDDDDVANDPQTPPPVASYTPCHNSSNP